MSTGVLSVQGGVGVPPGSSGQQSALECGPKPSEEHRTRSQPSTILPRIWRAQKDLTCSVFTSVQSTEMTRRQESVHNDENHSRKYNCSGKDSFRRQGAPSYPRVQGFTEDNSHQPHILPTPRFSSPGCSHTSINPLSTQTNKRKTMGNIKTVSTV